MVYGNFLTESVNEESECNPLGIYGALKFGGEKLVIAYNQVFKLPFTIISHQLYMVSDALVESWASFY